MKNMVAQTKQLDAQHWGGSIILIGIVLGAIGNLRQAKPFRLTPDKYMEMVTGFRGI